MVFEQYDDEPNYVYDGTSVGPLASAYGSIQLLDSSDCHIKSLANGPRLSEINMAHNTPYQQPSFMINNWSTLAESTLPLKTSALLTASSKRRQGGGINYGGTGDVNYQQQQQNEPDNSSSLSSSSFMANAIDLRARELKRKLIRVNVISLLINLILALVAFYFSFVNNSSSTSAFATDCVLDFISSAIVLWRYQGDNGHDLNSVYMHAREQIACIYLGALFEISALAIIIKASSDMSSATSASLVEASESGYDLVYLSIAATIAMSVLTIVKCSLYRTIRDKSLLLDVINTFISTIFAMSIIMSQLLINLDKSFWYLDPILSIILALFMMAFGAKVIHQNFNILRPSSENVANGHTLAPWLQKNNNNNNADNYQEFANYENNLISSIDFSRIQATQPPANWQKTDHSSIAFI